MNHDLLAADTAMGPVTLLVGDLDAQTRYYRDAVQLTVLSADGATVTLVLGIAAIAGAVRFSRDAFQMRYVALWSSDVSTVASLSAAMAARLRLAESHHPADAPTRLAYAPTRWRRERLRATSAAHLGLNRCGRCDVSIDTGALARSSRMTESATFASSAS